MESSNPVLNRYNRRGYASMGNPNVGTRGFGTSYDAQEGGQLEDLITHRLHHQCALAE